MWGCTIGSSLYDKGQTVLVPLSTLFCLQRTGWVRLDPVETDTAGFWFLSSQLQNGCLTEPLPEDQSTWRGSQQSVNMKGNVLAK